MATKLLRSIVITENSSAQWTTKNPVLANLEIGLEEDTGFFKIGDGQTSWTTLPYVMTPGTKSILVFPSSDPDNLIAYGDDGGIKVVGEYFNALSDYEKGKSNDTTVVTPARKYHLTIFTIGRDIKDLVNKQAALEYAFNSQTNAIGIDDTQDNSASKTWSTSKIKDHVVLKTLEIKSELLNGNEAAHQALTNLANHLAANPDMAAAVANEMGNAVKYNAEQTLSPQDKLKARNNIGAASINDLGSAFDVAVFYQQSMGKTAGSTLIESSI